jgi:hypothetical protein
VVIATVVVVVFLAIPVAFWFVLRSTTSDPDPALESAQGMAHRLLHGRESIDTDTHGGGRYVFRVVSQSSDGNVGSTLSATHIGVAVCMRGDRAVDAVRFSYLHFRPVCQGGRVGVVPQETSRAADRARAHGGFTRDDDLYDEQAPTPLGAR